MYHVFISHELSIRSGNMIADKISTLKRHVHVTERTFGEINLSMLHPGGGIPCPGLIILLFRQHAASSL